MPISCREWRKISWSDTFSKMVYLQAKLDKRGAGPAVPGASTGAAGPEVAAGVGAGTGVGSMVPAAGVGAQLGEGGGDGST